MKLSFITTLSLVLVVSVSRAEDKSTLKDAKDKLNYSMGLNMGTYLKRQEFDVNFDLFMKGIKDGVSGAKPMLEESEVREVLTNHQKDLRAKQEEKRKRDAEKNKSEGEVFLAENAKKPGVKTLPSGLQYKVINQGSGPSPKSADTVVTQYRGTLIDGTEFDSSYKRNSPATFRVSGVIPGWVEALQMMTVGSKWQLFVPGNLAYGERGAGPNIGPGATLIFEIELLSIKPPVEQTNQPVTSDIIKVPSAEELKAGAKIEVIKPGTVNK